MGDQCMKKNIIISVNVIIIVAILTFVVLYSRFESGESYRRQIEYFEGALYQQQDHDYGRSSRLYPCLACA